MRLIKTQEALDAGRTHTQTRESQAAGAEAGMREAAANARQQQQQQQRRLLSFPAFAPSRDSRYHASEWGRLTSLGRRGPPPWMEPWILRLSRLSRFSLFPANLS